MLILTVFVPYFKKFLLIYDFKIWYTKLFVFVFNIIMPQNLKGWGVTHSGAKLPRALPLVVGLALSNLLSITETRIKTQFFICKQPFSCWFNSPLSLSLSLFLSIIFIYKMRKPVESFSLIPILQIRTFNTGDSEPRY